LSVVDEAKLERSEQGGLMPKGEGWFVVNAKEARWFEHQHFGSGTSFEGEPEFAQLGINISIVEPGQPMCLYHRESAQEDFLVLSGEGRLLVEGEERPLKAWDFVHCPPETDHVFVGAGDGPCVIVAVGFRPKPESLVYPISELAAKYGASAEKETPSPKEAYEPHGRSAEAKYRGQLDS
jgi:uncharacterized cupin superfamily protein